MKILNAEFVYGAADADQLPKYTHPEIAFIGRSNVGKSSLLNSLVQRRQLAHISSTPGKTRQINFFLVNDQWMFVDLPGFGYAQVSKEERRKWQQFSEFYLFQRKQLRLVCLLVDSRHDPSILDMGMMESLEVHQRPFIVLLTKKDKIKPKEVEDRKKQFQEILQYCGCCLEVLPYSSRTYEGREQLLAVIKRVCSTSM